MLVRRQFIVDEGLMEEGYFLHSEELNCAMCGRGAFHLAFAPGSRGFHKARASTTKVLPRFSLYTLYRSRIRFSPRFVPARLHLARHRVARDFIALVFRGGWRSAPVLARELCETIFLGRLPTRLAGS